MEPVHPAENTEPVLVKPSRKPHGTWWKYGFLCLVGAMALIWLFKSIESKLRQARLNESLFQAAHYGGAGDLQTALDRGANPDAREPYGESALMLAAFYGHPDSVKLLLSRGARVDVKCKRGETALKWARQNGHNDIAQMLLRAGEQE